MAKLNYHVITPERLEENYYSTYSDFSQYDIIIFSREIKSIEGSVFDNCTNIKHIYYQGSLSEWLLIDFDETWGTSNPLCKGTNYLITDYAGPTSGTIYDSDLVDKNGNPLRIQKTITIPDRIDKIKGSSFYGYKHLSKIVFNEQIKEIGEHAFEGCTGLTSITIPESVTSIGRCAFEGCTGLKEVNFPENSKLTNVGERVFYGCTGLTSITIPKNVTSIGSSAFNGCTGLTSITIPENSQLRTIKNAFYRCTNFKEIYINDLSSWCRINLDYNAFENIDFSENRIIYLIGEDNPITSKEEITIPNDITIIGDNCFKNWKNLTSINIPNTVTSIGYRAFEGCTGLKNVYINDLSSWCKIKLDPNYYYPESIPTWNSGKLYLNGTEITDLVIPDDITSIGPYAFYGCSSITKVTIRENIKEIGEGAFNNCKNLKDIDINLDIENRKYLENQFLKTAWYDDQLDGPIYINHCLCGYKGIMPENTTINLINGITSIIPAAINYKNLISINNAENITHLYGGSLNSTAWYTKHTNGMIYLGKVLYKYKYSSIPSEITIKEGTTEICSSVIGQNTAIKTISIPNSVERIETRAFDNNPITTLLISENSQLTSIGPYAFNGFKLTEFFIPEKVTTIGTITMFGTNAAIKTNNLEAFCKLELTGEWDKGYANSNFVQPKLYLNNSLLNNINIPSGLTKINKYIFSSFSNILTITIPNTVTSIEEYSFYGCTGLTSINIPNTVTSIGERAFYGCTGLTSITIPDTVTSIGNSAFDGCTGLKEITLPNTITNIGDYAFNGCKNLTITLNHSKQLIIAGDAKSPVEDCKEIRVNLNNITDWVKNSIYKTNYNNSPIYFNNISDKIIIPSDKITYLPEAVFSMCKNIKNIELEEGIFYTDSYAFNNCTGLNSIIFPESLNFINDGVFYGCTGLTSITIPKNITSIEEKTFYGCTGLTSITIPGNVTKIKKNAFEGCTRLKEIIIDSGDEVLYINEGAFNGCTGLTSIVLNREIVCNDKNLFTNLTTLELGPDLEVIPYGVFTENKNITSISIPQNIITINERAFYGCTKLTSIIFSENSQLTTISDGAFEGCTGLTSINIPNTVTSIGSSAFNGCTGLTSINIPNTVTSIRSSAFNGCTGLEEINFSEDSQLTSIGEGAFEGCTGLTSFTIPGNVIEIENYAFKECTEITELIFKDGNKILSLGYNLKDEINFEGQGLFYDCPLKTVYLGRDLNYQGWNIHYDGIYLEDFIGESDNIFENGNGYNNNIYDINFGIIGWSPFTGKEEINTITISNSVTLLGNYLFSSCFGLKTIHIDNENSKLLQIGVFSIDELSIWWENNVNNSTNLVYLGKVLIGYGWEGSNEEIEIPDGTVGIAAGALNSYFIPNDVNIKKIKIPNSVLYIGPFSFGGNSSLTDITLPENISTIEIGTFYGCTSLEKINIPSSVKKLSQLAFGKCTALIEITLPEKLEIIETDTIITFWDLSDHYRFNGCKITVSPFTFSKNLKKINFNCTTIKDEWKLFTTKGELYYKDENIWEEPANGSPIDEVCYTVETITINKNTKTVSMNLQERFPELKRVIIDSIISWCEIDFKYNSPTDISTDLYYDDADNNQYLELDLTSSNITKINPRNFKNCKSLTKIILSDGIIIGEGAFEGCTGLETLRLAEGLKKISIKEGAFERCDNLINVYSNKSTWLGLEFNSESENFLSYLNIENLIFDESKVLEDLVINDSDNITKINDYLFTGYKKLKSVTLSNNIKEIGRLAFYNCSLQSIHSSRNTWLNLDFNDSSENPLSYCDDISLYLDSNILVDLTINDSDNITKINDYLLTGYKKLKSVTLSNNIETIGNGAFSETGISSLKIKGSTLKLIGKDAFFNCSELKTIDIYDENLWFLIKFANKYSNPISGNNSCSLNINGTKLQSITVPNSITELQNYIFYNYSSLSSITLHDNITNVGISAFEGCTGLTSIILPSKISKINAFTFKNCGNLKTIKINGDKIYELKMGAFEGCSSLTEISGLNEFIDDVLIIENDVFNGCSNLNISSTLKLNSLKELYSGFLGDVRVEYLDFSENTNIIEIPLNLFLNNTSLKSLKLPQRLRTIGISAFEGCTGLTSLEFPTTLTLIGSDSFKGCTSLSKISFNNINKYTILLGDRTFMNCTNLNLTNDLLNNFYGFGIDAFLNTPWYNEQGELIIVNKELVKYRGNSSEVNLESYDIQTIKKNAFKNNTSITKITLPITLKIIGESAFEGCTGLKTISRLSFVDQIKDRAFYGCSNLEIIDLTQYSKDNSEKISSLSGDYYLTREYLYISELGHYAFANCVKLEQICGSSNSFIDEDGDEIYRDRWPLNLSEIPVGLFQNCKSLYDINVGPDRNTSLRKLGNNCFSGAAVTNTYPWWPGLITDSPNLERIEAEAFKDLKIIRDLTIKFPDSLNFIGEGAFYSHEIHCSEVIFDFRDLKKIPKLGGMNVFPKSDVVKINVPRNLYYIWRDHPDWKNYRDNITVIEYDPTNNCDVEVIKNNNVEIKNYIIYYIKDENLTKVSLSNTELQQNKDTYKEISTNLYPKGVHYSHVNVDNNEYKYRIYTLSNSEKVTIYVKNGNGSYDVWEDTKYLGFWSGLITSSKPVYGGLTTCYPSWEGFHEGFGIHFIPSPESTITLYNTGKWW